jgi:glycosyltransferase involved in cell wall biosynthesis
MSSEPKLLPMSPQAGAILQAAAGPGGPAVAGRLTVILPAYNEAQHLYPNLLRVCRILQGCDLEVIVVDDGSQDKTLREAERAAAEGLPVRAVRQAVNRGKGAALFHGLQFATGDLIAFLDSDLEIAPEYVLRLWETMRATGAEVVIGAKSPAGNHFPLLRRLLSRAYRGLVAVLFGLSLSDTQTGVKLFRREVLELAAPHLSVSRFAFDIELIVAATRFGYRVVEHPVTTTYHRSGHVGRIGLGQMARMLVDTFAIYYRASFWRWLQPGWTTRLWMITFVLGVFLLGIGIGKLLTPVILQPPVSQVFYVIALQFLPRALRDWLLVIGGAAMLALSLIQLNKSLLSAFARRDRGDLAGILVRESERDHAGRS